MKKQLLLAGVLSCSFSAQAQSCEGGLFLNPQVIRGESTPQIENAVKDLSDFIRPTGLSVVPIINIKDVQDVAAGLKRPAPPCWIYGNPVVGLTSGYRPVAVNVDPIQSAVLVLADMGTVKDDKAIELKSLPADQQAKVLAKLKASSCFGIKSGVTTAMVKAENICGTVVEVVPQQGLGQSYLPTKAGFHWQADRWAGLITRVQSAQSTTLKGHYGTDERIHMAQLIVVPVPTVSWGYGLYVHPDAPAEATKKATALLLSLKTTNPQLLRTLDLGTKFDFDAPTDALIKAMRKSLAIGP
jgi:hypothetical protein